MLPVGASLDEFRSPLVVAAKSVLRHFAASLAMVGEFFHDHLSERRVRPSVTRTLTVALLFRVFGFFLREHFEPHLLLAVTVSLPRCRYLLFALL